MEVLDVKSLHASYDTFQGILNV